MEIHHLRYFLTVARALDFAKAAQALQMSVRPLRLRIEAMETELGAALFEPATRPVRLTPAGARLVPLAAGIVTDFDALRERLSAPDDRPIDVRLAMPELLGADIGHRLSTAMAELAPEYTFALERLRAADIEAGLRGHHLDLALSHIPSAGSDVESAVIATEPVGVLVGSTRFEGRTSVRLADLRGFTHIKGPRHWELGHGDRAETALSGAGISTGRDRFKTLDGMLMMLRQTRGFILAPFDSDGLHAFDRAEFRFLPVEDLNLDVTTVLLWRTGDERFARLAAELAARLRG
ncbi:LysR family transcriptional regulator [Nocardia sp. NPDC057030]|uniref:LysR family transcriptional regulator n=1 Tax=unclassified Nocardia TaxID=2637762 RepID=UPI00362F0B6F